MKVQDHINLIDGASWCRCKRVEFIGETASWELSRTGRYSFSEAYQMTPHRQLIRAKDDESLRGFVKAWGPLSHVLNDWSGSDPLKTYRTERDRLTALVRLIASVREPETQRSALLELAKAPPTDGYKWAVVWGLARRSAQLPVPNLPREWLVAATPKQLEIVTETVISAFAAPFAATKFTAEPKGGSYSLKASLNLKSLPRALNWMVWHDLYNNRPMQFCVECRDLIDSTTKHAKRFCSPECAHRKTAREWQRKKRKGKETNGTEKTR